MDDLLTFKECAALLKYPTVEAAYVSRKRGIFPVRVRSLGGKLICFRHDYNRYIETGVSQADLSCGKVREPRKPHPKKPGRPTKMETLEARRRGLTVRELRAQSEVAGV